MRSTEEIETTLAAEYAQFLPPAVLTNLMTRGIGVVMVTGVLGRFAATCNATGVIEHFVLAGNEDDAVLRAKLVPVAARLAVLARPQLRG